jgi:hypothetical protein
VKRLAEILVVGIGGFVAFPMTAVSQRVTWLPFQGGNGHSYEVIAVAGGIRWSDASLAATNRGGYLATVTSSGENSFIFSVAREQSSVWFNGWGPWLGGYQPPGSPEPAGGWAWVTGEPFVFQNWMSGQPNNSGGAEDRIHYGGMAGPSEVWNDLGQNGTNFARGYVVEYDPPGAVLTLAASATGDVSPPQASGAPVTNGNFVIHNCCPFSPTGDGKDEFTLWTFDFSGDPNLPFFLEPTQLSSAILSLTLTPGTSPILSDSVRIESFPEIRAPVLRTLALGVTTNIQVDLLAYYSPTDVLNFLRDTGGPVAMIYQKDAVVSYAELRLTRPDVRVRIRLRIQDGALQICWNSELNRPYQVQYSAALGEPWLELSSGVLGNGTTNCVNTRQVSSQRFYRVMRVQ